MTARIEWDHDGGTVAASHDGDEAFLDLEVKGVRVRISIAEDSVRALATDLTNIADAIDAGEETVRCEACDRVKRREDVVSGEDGYLCGPCVASFEAEEEAGEDAAP